MDPASIIALINAAMPLITALLTAIAAAVAAGNHPAAQAIQTTLNGVYADLAAKITVK